MGLANVGGNRSVRYPSGVAWKWAQNKGGENQLWAGSGSAGLRLKLKGLDFDWESPLHMQSNVPKSWGGDNATGGVAVHVAACVAADVAVRILGNLDVGG